MSLTPTIDVSKSKARYRRDFSKFWESYRTDYNFVFAKATGTDKEYSPLPELTLERLYSLSYGWAARYEIFALNDRAAPQASANIPLDEDEIALFL